MALRTARSTPEQRLALLKLHDDLQSTLDSATGRYWLTNEAKNAYKMVLKHLERWQEFESEKVENHDG
jgi:hypothetical protein